MQRTLETIRKQPDLKSGKRLGHLTKEEDIPMQSKHMKSCPISSVSQELQIKMRCHYMSFRMMKIQKAVKTKSWQGCD